MKTCPNCHMQMDDNTAFCPNCGAPVNNQSYQANYQAPYQAPVVSPWDHTAEYDPEDIKQNRFFGLICYLIPVLGIIYTLLAAPNSPYAKYQVKQALRFTVLESLTGMATALLWWTILVPIAAAIFGGFLLVIKIIAIVDVISGKVKEPWMIRSFTFLK